MAKFRLQTDPTLDDLGNSGTRLGNIIRKFKTGVCNDYATRDLPSEEAARGRRQAAKVLKVAEAQNVPGGSQAPAPLPKPSSKKRIFNMETYKLHSLPDVPAAIRAFGVTENTSTLNVSNFICKINLPNISTGRKRT
jgi:hypothetical protein